MFLLKMIVMMAISPLIFNIFSIAEKNRLETLYATLSITRCDIVKARYLFFICVLAIVIFQSLLLTLLFSQNSEKFYDFAAFIFISASFLAVLWYPLFFRIGTTKTYFTLFALFVIFVCAIIFFPSFRGSKLGISATSPVTITIVSLFLCLSYLLSLKIYRTKDLG
jgi:hypothetical protein